MDYKMIFLTYIVLGILLLLFGIKIFYFKNATSYKTVKRFFYFSSNSIYNSDSSKSMKLKVLQNKLSFVILILLIFLLLVIKFVYSN